MATDADVSTVHCGHYNEPGLFCQEYNCVMGWMLFHLYRKNSIASNQECVWKKTSL